MAVAALHHILFFSSNLVELKLKFSFFNRKSSIVKTGKYLVEPVCNKNTLKL